MKHPQKHAALIKQWADGAEIQYLSVSGSWRDVAHPGWDINTEYRVKPEPKPDVVLYGHVERADWGAGGHRAKFFCCFADEKQINSDTVMFVFDGETGKLKDCQVLVSSGE